LNASLPPGAGGQVGKFQSTSHAGTVFRRQERLHPFPAPGSRCGATWCLRHDVAVTSAPHPSVLLLSLHGTAHVQCGSLTMPLRGRAAALVALAALQPEISRERTAAWLWPNAPNARQNLRQQLLRFRQTLGTALVAGDERLQLAPGVQLVSPGAGKELLADEEASDDAFGLWLEQQRDAERQARREPLLQALSAAEQAGGLDSALAGCPWC